MQSVSLSSGPEPWSPAAPWAEVFMKVKVTSHRLPYPQPHGGDWLLASGRKGWKENTGRKEGKRTAWA